MVRQRWWRAARPGAGKVPQRRRGKRARNVFLGPDIVLSGEIRSCDTLVTQGTIESNRVECRKFVLGNAGSFKGAVETESAVISGRFEGRLRVEARLVVRSGGHVRGSVQYGQLEIEPGGELQGDVVMHAASQPAADDELDILDIAGARKSALPTGHAVAPAYKAPLAVRAGGSDRVIDIAAEKPELVRS